MAQSSAQPHRQAVVVMAVSLALGACGVNTSGLFDLPADAGQTPTVAPPPSRDPRGAPPLADSGRPEIPSVSTTAADASATDAGPGILPEGGGAPDADARPDAAPAPSPSGCGENILCPCSPTNPSVCRGAYDVCVNGVCLPCGDEGTSGLACAHAEGQTCEPDLKGKGESHFDCR